MSVVRVRLTESRVIEADVSTEHVEMLTGRTLEDAAKTVSAYAYGTAARNYLENHGNAQVRRPAVLLEILPESVPSVTPGVAPGTPTNIGVPTFVAAPESNGEAGETESAEVTQAVIS